MAYTEYTGHYRIFKRPYKGDKLELYSIWSSPKGNMTAYFKDKNGKDKFLYKRQRISWFEYDDKKKRYVQKTSKPFFLTRWSYMGSTLSPSKKSFYDQIRKYFNRYGKYGSKDNYITARRDKSFAHYKYNHNEDRYVKVFDSREYKNKKKGN